jgi:hypothetical protein
MSVNGQSYQTEYGNMTVKATKTTFRKKPDFFNPETDPDPDRKPTFQQKNDPDPNQLQKVNPAGLYRFNVNFTHTCFYSVSLVQILAHSSAVGLATASGSWRRW